MRRSSGDTGGGEDDSSSLSQDRYEMKIIDRVKVEEEEDEDDSSDSEEVKNGKQADNGFIKMQDYY